MTSIRHNTAAETSPDDAYLDAAREAILAVGWSRTTLTDVARRAGVSRMTLYRRWPDMRTMLADLMTREWTRTVGDSVLEADGDPLTRLSRGVVATVRALRGNVLLRRIIDVDPEVLLPYLLQRRGRSQELVVDLLAGIVREGQRSGDVRGGDARRLAGSVVLACHGFVLSAHTMLDGEDGRGAGADADVSAFDHELGRLVEGYLRP